MSYLHDETNGAEGRALQQHLGECSECRAQVTAWQETRRRLDIWKLAPPPARSRALAFAWPRWAMAAAAAVVVLIAGVSLGRSAGPSQAALASLRSEVQELRANLSAWGDESHSAESRRQLFELVADLNNRIGELQAQQVSLRRALETVAVLTQASFDQTENRFVALSNTRQPESNQ
jgi:hypothetical protein